MQRIMRKIIYKFLVLTCPMVLSAASLISCSDEPDASNYYTFKGEMMSDYILNRPDYSSFAQIVSKAELMDLLSAYGEYTCFLPTNDAVADFLATKNKSIDDLTKLECDTIARTHLLSRLISTFELADDSNPLNLMGRPVVISHDQDEDENAVVVLNGNSIIYFKSQNDSVENGIVHPINTVLESSTSMLPDFINKDKSLSIYADALNKTGLSYTMMAYCDEVYEKEILTKYTGNKKFKDYKSGAEPMEYATPPDKRLYGFTAFMVKDSILKEKYHIEDLNGLYELACSIYGNTGSFDDLKNPENPLYKFMAYHVLDRKVKGYKNLTCQAEKGTTFQDFGFFRTLLNPNDWYGTLLPYSRIKVERLTAEVGDGVKEDWYLNRRFNDKFSVPGSHVTKAIDKDPLNGTYFYIDDVLRYDETTRELVMNCRMRSDMSAIFPELTTTNIRMNGNIAQTGEAVDHSKYHENGRNYFFPNGYLDGVSIGGNGYFIYRRPRQGYWSLHGDEFICQGDYDVTFRIPPVPFDSEWQLRLGYAAMDGVRGVAQIYFGEDPDNLEPQGIPLDMNRDLRKILNVSSIPTYGDMSETQMQEEYKTLKNKGYYRGCYGGYRSGGTDQQHFYDIYATLRIVLCTYHMKPNTDYYVRLRAVSSKSGNDNEAMLDYIELVPKSVWGISDGDDVEDNL